MGLFSKTVRHAQRYGEIVSILVKYGMGDIAFSLQITKKFPFTKKLLPKKNNVPVSKFSKWEGIRMALEELGPAFIKFGQMLSNRPDIIPLPLIKEFEKLQDGVPPFEYEEAVKIIEEELNAPLSSKFRRFNKKPIAAASISQIHKAKLHDGTTVAVKVRRPDIDKTIETDIEILYTLASLAEKNIEGVKLFEPVRLVSEFEEHIKEELDFNIERSNIERFYKDFENDGRVYFLKAYKDFSAKRVITMTFIDGVKVSRISADNLEGYDRSLLAANGAQIILKQIFINGYFHADPHPGNIMIMPDNKICFIDFGMMGSLIQSQRDNMGALIVALMRRDSQLFTYIMLTIVNEPDHDKLNEIEYRVQKIIGRYIDLPLEDINIADVLMAVTGLLAEFKLKVPSNFSLMVKALITIEGVGRQLSPDFQLIAVIQNFSKTIIKNSLSPKRFIRSAAVTFLETQKLIESAPRDIRELLHKAKQGGLKIELEHKDLGGLRSSLEETGNRMVFGMALASLIIGSSIMIHANIEPKWNGISIIGLIGFLLSAVMAAYILFLAMFERIKKK